jgi:hypothetical protein
MQSKLIKKQINYNTLPKFIISHIKTFFNIIDNIKIQLIDVKWYSTKYTITDFVVIEIYKAKLMQYVVNKTNFYNIEHLDLSFIELTNDIINLVCNISKLKKLNLEKTNITDDNIKLLLLKKNNISDLNISDCKYLTDECMSYIKYFPSLQKLDLSYSCNITEKGISCLIGNNSLISLNLSEFCDSNNSLIHISKITNLEKLNISDNDLYFRNIKYLVNNKKLHTLYISSDYQKNIKESSIFKNINIIYKFCPYNHLCSHNYY